MNSDSITAHPSQLLMNGSACAGLHYSKRVALSLGRRFRNGKVYRLAVTNNLAGLTQTWRQVGAIDSGSPSE